MSAADLHFVHVGDSHVASGDAREAGLGRLRAFVERVEGLRARGVPLDFVVHTGDLVDDAERPEATAETSGAALAVLDRLPLRWFLLNGNHDRRDFLAAGSSDASGARASGHGEVPPTDPLGIARVEVGAVQLLFVDACPGAGGRGDLEGALGPETIAAIGRRLDAHGGRSALFLHYPPLAAEAPWPGAMAGGEALHATLASRASRLHGVFVGHNHRGVHHLRDGVLYVTAPALSRQFLLWPGQREHEVDAEPVAGLHYVTLGADGTTRVQHHAFALIGADTAS